MPRDKDADLERFGDIADELGLDDDERDDFISASMKRLGYQAKVITEWLLGDDDKSNDGGDFFSRRNKDSERRPVQGRRERPERGSERRGGGYGQFGS